MRGAYDRGNTLLTERAKAQTALASPSTETHGIVTDLNPSPRVSDAIGMDRANAARAEVSLQVPMPRGGLSALSEADGYQEAISSPTS